MNEDALWLTLQSLRCGCRLTGFLSNSRVTHQENKETHSQSLTVLVLQLWKVHGRRHTHLWGCDHSSPRSVLPNVSALGRSTLLRGAGAAAIGSVFPSVATAEDARPKFKRPPQGTQFVQHLRPRGNILGRGRRPGVCGEKTQALVASGFAATTSSLVRLA